MYISGPELVKRLRQLTSLVHLPCEAAAKMMHTAPTNHILGHSEAPGWQYTESVPRKGISLAVRSDLLKCLHCLCCDHFLPEMASPVEMTKLFAL